MTDDEDPGDEQESKAFSASLQRILEAENLTPQQRKFLELAVQAPTARQVRDLETRRRGHAALLVKLVNEYLHSGTLAEASEASTTIAAILEWFVTRPLPDERRRLKTIHTVATSETDGLKAKRAGLARLICGIPQYKARLGLPEDHDGFAPFIAQHLATFPGLEWIADRPDHLAEKLKDWTPTQATGKKTAERILAELIVESEDALGYSQREDEDADDAIERIRKALARDR